MMRKNFGGLPADAGAVICMGHNGIQIVGFNTRNEAAAELFRSCSHPHAALKSIAEDACCLPDQPSDAAKMKVVCVDSKPVAIALEGIELEESGDPTSEDAEIIHVGLYGLPRDMSVGIDERDEHRISEWIECVADTQEKIENGVVALWISVSDPVNELLVGRMVLIEKLDNGDCAAIEFAGFRAGVAPFTLRIAAADEVAHLKAVGEAP